MIERFLTGNLLPALVAGVVAWGMVSLGVRLFGIRHGRLRLCLFLAPPIKSTLVLLGLLPVLPWPRDAFARWAALAFGPEVILPFFLAATGLGFLGHARLASRERARVLRAAVPARDMSPRLAAAYERVTATLRRDRTCLGAECICEPDTPTPLLLTHDAERSPMAVSGERPAIVFPLGLVDKLDDRQLEGALAHELAHLHLRRHLSCTSSELVRRFTAVSPFALAVAGQLAREEEQACDDVAVAATGDPGSYADMLLAGYRYASGRPAARVPATVPGLLGARSELARRIERQVAERPPSAGLRAQRVGFWLLWCVLVPVLFSG